MAHFDPDTAYVGIHSTMSEKYMRRDIFKFNFPLGTEVAFPRHRNVASLCSLGWLD